MTFQERKYQTRAKEAFQDWVKSDERLGTVILPTGVGKTATASLCLSTLENQKVLWVAHREELITQAHGALSQIIPGRDITIEMADQKANVDSDIVVGSVQTVSRNRKHFQDFRPDVIVIDEYHHYSEDNVQYDGLLERWPEAKIMGLTATPWRFSGETLPLGKVLIQMDVGTAIEKGYLVPPTPETLISNVSLAEVGTRAGDFEIKGLANAVNVDERNLLIVKKVLELVKERKRQGILFGVNVAHSHALYEMLKNEVRAAEVYGDTPIEERRQIMAAIKNGEVDVLCNNLVCLDEETEILTRAGWTNIDQITKESEVANWDQGRIWFSRPEAIIKRQRRPEEKMVVLETAKRSIRVTEDHELLYRTYDSGKFLKKKAIDLVQKAIKIPVSGMADPIDVALPQRTALKSSLAHRISANAYAIRKRNPSISIKDSKKLALEEIKKDQSLSLKNPKNLTKADCQFIGFWIGDGTVSKLKSGGLEYSFSQSVANINIINWFDSVLENLNYDYRRRTKVRSTPKRPEPHEFVSWSFSRGTGFSSQRRKGIFDLETYLQKEGTNLFWSLDEIQFDSLLEGLWKSDGDHLDGNFRKNGFVIYQKNKKLLELLQAIAVCRGYVASLRKYKNGKNWLYNLFLRKETDHKLTKYRLKIESEWKDERVWCVKTPSSNLITRRRGSVTVMGNCTEGFDVPHLSFVVTARPTRSLSLFIQMIGRGLRSSPGKTDCIVVDVCDKIKARQSRVSFSDMARAGDIYGDHKRANNVLKAELPIDKVHKTLKNFPVFLRSSRTDRWQVDEDSWSVGSWALDESQWIVSWGVDVKTPKIINKPVWAPFDSIPEGINIKGRPVIHEKFGEGVIKDIAERGEEAKVLVTFDWNIDRIISIKFLKRKGFVQEHAPGEFETCRKERLFYICCPPRAEKGRLLVCEKQYSDLVVQEDLFLSRTEIDQHLVDKAKQDGNFVLVRADAKWKSEPATPKQLDLIQKFLANGKIGFDLDLDSLSKGDVSAILDQSKWQDLIVKKFSTDLKGNLLGYDISTDDF